MKDNVNEKKDIVHISFEIGLLLKGIHGLTEIVGGALMFFLTPNRVSALTRFLTKHELSEDPRDLVANFLLSLSSSFSISTQHFAVFYLMSHGIIKCILILLLWRRKLWAYPLAIVSLILFIAYQVYRYTFTQSVFLIMLSIFDAVMIALTWLEYKNLKASVN
ncbi:MAG: DUF2127 domain-containing protein [Oscillospiraceae bacterium]|nr:DUF2127 domain-containing protein [Oscillospiraceae bacterium]